MNLADHDTTRNRRLLLGVLAGLLLAALAYGISLVGPSGTAAPPGAGPGAATPSAVESTDPETGLAWVDVGALPPEAGQVLGLIDEGGPFKHKQDGQVFGNREALLPSQDKGFYREYTVRTPGESDRGARRIVTGNEKGAKRGDGEVQYFWTDDHYESFARIRR